MRLALIGPVYPYRGSIRSASSPVEVMRNPSKSLWKQRTPGIELTL